MSASQLRQLKYALALPGLLFKDWYESIFTTTLTTIIVVYTNNQI